MPVSLTRRLVQLARRSFPRLVLGLVLVALGGLGILAVVPPGLDGAPPARPAASYAEAVSRITALQNQEAATHRPECVTQFLGHGQPSARVLVLVHGYGNCPQMFAQLAQAFFAQGANVLIVPLPHHGLADRLTDDLTHLTAEELAAYTGQVLDIAAGLGQHITLAGLSAGGLSAAWAAQTRPDLDQAVVIAPAFGLKLLPAPLTILATRLAPWLPDVFIWWNPALREQFTPLYYYPRFSARGLAQVVRFGLAVRAHARQAAPVAPRLLVITNANDQAVDNVATAQVVAAWRAHGAAVDTFEFPASLGLVHNLIDPGETGQQVALVYPQLLALMGAP